MKDEIVLIPAYKPDEKMVELVHSLVREDFTVIVVNDGSPSYHDCYFQAVASVAGVVTLPENRGKGAALKAGMEVIRDHHPECEIFITADADGQHSVKDILRVRDELRTGSRFVLTVRNLSGDIPKRSKLGNRISRIVYTTLTGHYLNDNQSGLRGFSAEHIGWMLRVGGDKYDYEMNILYHADKQAIPITTMGIDTIYLDGNRSSHFKTIPDTLRIYRKLFSSAWVTFAAVLLTELMMLELTLELNFDHVLISVPSIGIQIAFFNVLLNKFAAFRKYRYADGLRTVIHTLCRFCVYGVLCNLLHLMFPWRWASLIVLFNFVAIAMIPVEYVFHKFMHKFKYREIVKE